MTTEPLVSIVMPTLNQGDFIIEALESIWHQDYPNIELIVIDGASTDETINILERCRSKIDILVSEKDNGTSEAINKGWGLASGDFLWVLNSDDRLYSDQCISTLVDFLSANSDIAFVYGDMLIVSGSGRRIGYRRFSDYTPKSLICDRRHLPWPGCLMRKSVLSEIGMLNLKLYYSNDLEFYLRLFSRFKTAHLDYVTGIFRLHRHASTQKHIIKSGEETLEVCRKFSSQNFSHDKVFQRRAEIKMKLFETSINFHGNRATMVRKAIWELLQLNPLYIFHPKLVIYLTGSLLGDYYLSRFSEFFRKLFGRSIFFRLNNLLSVTFLK